MNNISNWITGSFFRTIGRVLAYVFIGFIIAYFGSKIDFNKLRDFDFRQLGYKIIGIDTIKADTINDYFLQDNTFSDSISDFSNSTIDYSVNMFNQNFNYMKASNVTSDFSYITLYSETSGDYILWILQNSGGYSSLDLICSPDGSSTTSINNTCIINNISTNTKTMYRLYINNPTSNLNFRTARTLTPIDSINVLTGYITQKNSSLFTNGEYCVLNSQSNGSNVPFTYNGVSYNCSGNIDQPTIDYDLVLFENDFYLFYDFNDISQFDIFSSYDFTTFTDFEKLVIVFGFNILYLLFIFVIVYIVIKVIYKMLSWLFG